MRKAGLLRGLLTAAGAFFTAPSINIPNDHRNVLKKRNRYNKSKNPWSGYRKRSAPWYKRSPINQGHLVRICPGKTHAWFDTRVGIIRKPISSMTHVSKESWDKNGGLELFGSAHKI